MPKPIATGIVGFALRTAAIMLPRSVLIWLRTPVTPKEETQYKKPFASLAIFAIRSWEVGAIKETKAKPYCWQT